MQKCNKINNTKYHDVYIIDLVHNYFYIFHAWTADTKYQKFIISTLQITTFISIILFTLIYFYHLANIYFDLVADYFAYTIIIFFINFIIQSLSLTIGFLILSPINKSKITQKRILNLFYCEVELNNVGQNNFYTDRFELEKAWIQNVLGGNNDIDDLIKKVTVNLQNRKPTSRSIDTVISNAIQNPYIINSLVVIFTVSLTIGLSPLIPSISDENFTSVFKMLNITAVNIWFIIVFIFIIAKIVFMVFECSFEYSINNKQFIVWRYELFLDMLARHQQVKTHKPKIRLPAKLST